MGARGYRRLMIIGVAGTLIASVLFTPSPLRTANASTAPNPSSWKTWILSSSDQFRLGAPPNRRSATTRKELRRIERYQRVVSKRERRLIKRWARGPATLPWTAIALDMLLVHRPGAFPTRSARIFGLLHLGMYDAVVAAWDSRAQYRRRPPFRVDDEIRRLAASERSSYPDIYAAVAGAAERILAYVYPNEPSTTFTRLADQATRARLVAGVAYPSDVAQGRLLGNRVAEAVIASGEADGHKNAAAPVLASRVCSTPGCDPNADIQWVPTPFHYQYPPTDPAASTWKTRLLSSPSQFRPPLPYAYDSPQFCTELKEVYDTNNTADEGQRRLAFFWDDGPGTYSPAGHWNDIAVDVVRDRRLSTEHAALVFALMNVAIVDTFIAVWDAKYAYWTQRPVTAIRERPSVCAGQVHDPNWLPNIITPPFPAFPSGHSGESAAAARVLQYFFPNPGLDPASLVGNYGTAGSFDAVAAEVAFSRLIAGIHFRADNDAGLILGRKIGDLAIAWAQANGVGPLG
jgi:membrane-associated phospholipid phosphatase